MSDEWRAWFYLLGLVPQLLFGGRFLIQWLASERKHRSYVPIVFWRMSLVGHLLMVLHSSIQLQYHVCLTQACNAVIAWRNLDLMGKSRYGIRAALFAFISAITAVTGLFFWEVGSDFSRWFRVPHFVGMESVNVLAWEWHLFGSFGLILFSSRFWVQWWQAERQKRSYLSPAFWWLSFSGNTVLFVYFWRLGDFVNWIGPLLSVIPALRNLVLLKRATCEGKGNG